MDTVCVELYVSSCSFYSLILTFGYALRNDVTYWFSLHTVYNSVHSFFLDSLWIPYALNYMFRAAPFFAHFDVWICVIRNGVLHTVHTYSSHIGRYHQILSFSCQATSHEWYDKLFNVIWSERRIACLMHHRWRIFFGKRRRTLNCLRLYHHSLSFSCQATPMMKWQPNPNIMQLTEERKNACPSLKNLLKRGALY